GFPAAPPAIRDSALSLLAAASAWRVAPAAESMAGVSTCHLHTLCTCITRDLGPIVRLSHRRAQPESGRLGGWLWGVEMGIPGPGYMLLDTGNEKRVASARAPKILIGTPSSASLSSLASPAVSWLFEA